MQGGPPSHGASAFIAGGFHDVDVIGDLGEALWEGAGCVRDDGVTAFGEGSDHDEVSDHDGRCGLAWNAENVVAWYVEPELARDYEEPIRMSQRLAVDAQADRGNLLELS